VGVRITSAGRELTPEVAAMSRAENQRFLDILEPDEAQEFLALLRKLVAGIDA
jgi:DNA-binding MarR family transcriptional regulator